MSTVLCSRSWVHGAESTEATASARGTPSTRRGRGCAQPKPSKNLRNLSPTAKSVTTRALVDASERLAAGSKKQSITELLRHRDYFYFHNKGALFADLMAANEENAAAGDKGGASPKPKVFPATFQLIEV